MFTEQSRQAQTSRTVQSKTEGQSSVSQFKDNRPVSTAFQTLQRFADDEQDDALQGKFSEPVQREEDEEEPLQGKFATPIQRVTEDEEEPLQGKFAVQREAAPNLTGMPVNLKSGVENLSGFSMDSVRVHYNSPKPATVQALAYTQGTDIHVAPGQEQHLPHEAWHVAQQMAGRVSPTTNVNVMPVNDNVGLEHEADVMGARAVQSVQRKQNYINCIPKHNSIQLLTKDQTRILKKSGTLFTLSDSFCNKHVREDGYNRASVTKYLQQRGTPGQTEIHESKENIIAKIKSLCYDSPERAHVSKHKTYGVQVFVKIKGDKLKHLTVDQNGNIDKESDFLIVGPCDEKEITGNHFESNLTKFPVNDDDLLVM